MDYNDRRVSQPDNSLIFTSEFWGLSHRFFSKYHNSSLSKSKNLFSNFSLLSISNSRAHLNLSKLFLVGSLCLLGNSVAVAGLSAVTANTIEGTRPYLVLSDGTMKLTDLDKLLGFSMPNPDGTATRVQIDAKQSVALTAPPNMKFSDVVTLVLADGNTNTIPAGSQVDDDGDSGTPLGTMTVVWKSNGVPISAGDLNQPLIASCGSRGPYTLTISVANAEAKTAYGAPDNRVYGSDTKTYTFVPNGQGICYIQPHSMQIFTSVDGAVKYANGYNDKVWVPGKGFSVSLMNNERVIFPTTGFLGAKFSLLGSGGDQSVFRCSSASDGREITLSTVSGVGSNCVVTYSSKPEAPIIINMEYNDGSNWVQLDSYTIPKPTKWAIGGALKSYGNGDTLVLSTRFDVLDYCRSIGPNADNGTTTAAEALGVTGSAFRQKYLYRRDELTNSPYADRGNYPEGSSPTHGGRFSRDVGNFTGEWGLVNGYNGSPWVAHDYYWSAEEWSTDYHSGVFSHGGVSYGHPDRIYYTAVCRGE